MKKLINQPDAVLPEFLEGLVSVSPGLRLLPNGRVVVRADLTDEVKDREVALISGGGSGHEPAHVGYVGAGMLSAAVAGDVFTSPSTDSVLQAIRAVTGAAGAILIVKNYTGDRLNFGLAAEIARAEGLAVEVVMVGDDVALARMASAGAGRRGIAGTVFVHKIAGASAAEGSALPVVVDDIKAAIESIGSMGVALSPCTVPAAGKPSFTLGEDEIELGLGIHGEEGFRRTQIEPVDSLVDQLVTAIVEDRNLNPGEDVALLVNNLGATTIMELNIAARSALQALADRKIIVQRAFVGTFLSALEMGGCSISLMRLNERRLRQLDREVDAPAWPRTRIPDQPLSLNKVRLHPKEIGRDTAKSSPRPAPSAAGQRLSKAIQLAAQSLIDAESHLTELDRIVGDGDMGISLERGAKAIKRDLHSYDLDNPAATLAALSQTVREALGGSSGPLYAVFFLRAAKELEHRSMDERPEAQWARAFLAGCQGMSDLGGAKKGDRTMLDALWPAAEALASAVETGQNRAQALAAAVQAAKDGAEATRHIVARRGRSSYLGDRALGHPDPGAVAVGVWLEAMRGLMEERA
jgi:triose/dihydroxyacetone kinase / FAD-AMP lyase (cyclizing)